MFDKSRPSPIKPSAVRRGRFGDFWRGESLAFFSVFVLGLLFFLVQLVTWAIPQLSERQNFVAHRSVVLDTRVQERSLEKSTSGSAETARGYRPEVLVEYSVRNTTYRVWAFDFRTLTADQGFFESQPPAAKALEPFTVGREIRCWYREDDPAKAVVVWRVPVFGWFLLLLSFSFIVLGIVGFVQSFRRDALSRERKAAAWAGREILRFNRWSALRRLSTGRRSQTTASSTRVREHISLFVCRRETTRLFFWSATYFWQSR